MVEYREFITRLKGERAPVNYDQMLDNLQQKISKEKPGISAAFLAGALVILIAGSVFYYNYRPSPIASDELVFSYVFGQSEIADGPVMDYVFSDY